MLNALYHHRHVDMRLRLRLHVYVHAIENTTKCKDTFIPEKRDNFRHVYINIVKREWQTERTSPNDELKMNLRVMYKPKNKYLIEIIILFFWLFTVTT